MPCENVPVGRSRTGRQAEPLDELVRDRAAAAGSAQRCDEVDVLLGRGLCDEATDIGAIADKRSGGLRTFGRAHVEACDRQAAGAVRVDAADRAERRRLPGTVAPEHAEHAALGDLQREPVHGYHVPVPDGQLFEVDACHGPYATDPRRSAS